MNKNPNKMIKIKPLKNQRKRRGKKIKFNKTMTANKQKMTKNKIKAKNNNKMKTNNSKTTTFQVNQRRKNNQKTIKTLKNYHKRTKK